MTETRPDIIAADWLVPMTGRNVAVRLGGVRIDARGTILAVGPIDDVIRPGDRARFLPDCVLTPGLVNAHTHLDLGKIEGATKRAREDATEGQGPADPSRRSLTAGRPLHEWVVDVMCKRQALPADHVAAITVGAARRSLASGVTTVIDVTPVRTWPAVQSALVPVPLRRVALLEVLGFGDRGRQLWADAESIVSTWAGRDRDSAGQALPPSFGLSPHAPYSTCAAIYRHCLAVSGKRGLPVMTHLSETREEIEFCQTGAGPWRDLLEKRYDCQDPRNLRFRAWPGPESQTPGSHERTRRADEFDLAVPGCSPVAYASRVGLLDYEQTLLAHANYLEPGDLELLVPSRERQRAGSSGPTVVYCPRSADYFGHRNHPWRAMLAAGVNVAIGTDSLASCPDLSIINELRFLHELCPDVPAGELFALATRSCRLRFPNAPSAMDNCQNAPVSSVGTLVDGATADIVAWPIDSATDDADAILRSVIESAPTPRAVFLAGEAVDELPA